MKNILIYITCWLGLAILAVFNGIIREKVYSQTLPEISAHQLSTLIAILLFGCYIYFITGIFKLQSAHQAILIGVIWLIMTIAFEFFFGHYIIGHSWSRLFHDYHILKGRVWILVLIWTTIAPYLFYRMRIKG